MIRSVLIITLVVNAAIAVAQETPSTAPAVEPAVLQAAEEKYASEVGKAEAALAKVKREAAALRLKAYKDRLAEITKSGDFNKALTFKARIDQLEAEPESASAKPPKKPRPKDTVKFAGHTYALIKEPATWHVAKQRCEEMGGHLVCIETSNEELFVKSLCGQLTTWVGASDEETEGTWLWVHKSSPVKIAMQIDNAGAADHHLALFTGLWHDGPAGSKYAYICEWEN